MLSLTLWYSAAFLLCSGWFVVHTSAQLNVQTPEQIEASLTKIRQLEQTGDEYFPNSPRVCRQQRMIRRLPPEAVPVLMRHIQAAVQPKDEKFYIDLLRQKINYYGVGVPENVRQTSIDFLLSLYDQPRNARHRPYLLDQLRWIDDPKIDMFVGRLGTSADPLEQRTIAKFNEERPSRLAAMRKKPQSQTREQIVASIEQSLHPEKSYQGYVGELTPESVALYASILSQGLRDSQDEKERWRYFQLLYSRLYRDEDALPTPVWQDAIDAMINECERAYNDMLPQPQKQQIVPMSRRLDMLACFEDPRIDRYFDSLVTSPVQDAQAAAIWYVKEYKNR